MLHNYRLYNVTCRFLRNGPKCQNLCPTECTDTIIMQDTHPSSFSLKFSLICLNYIWMIIILSVYACRVGGNSWILCLVSLQHIEDHSRSLAWNNSYQGAWLVTLRSEVSFLYSSNRCQVLLFFLNFNESHEFCIDHYEITLVNKLLNVSETCNCKQLLKWFFDWILDVLIIKNACGIRHVLPLTAAS